MTASAIWISTDEARSFRFTPEKVLEQHFKRADHPHHTNQQNSHHADAHEDDKFFKVVADALLKESSDRFLLMGSGTAKTHFNTFAAKNHPRSKIVGVETTDKMSDKEMIDFAHTFFKKFDALNG